METGDKRKFERYKIEMLADIVTKSGRISAVACDISESGVEFRAVVFPKEKIMEIPSNSEMLRALIDEIKELGGWSG